MIQVTEKICPKCRSRNFKPWADLDRDEKIAAESRSASTKFTPTQRKKRRICTRCWFEQSDQKPELA